MKLCIYGAGAIGGLIGGRLALAGHTVSAVARGATAAALGRHGFRLEIGGERHAAPVRVAEDPAALGRQDLVVIAVKGPALDAVAERIAPLLGPETVVLTAMNGVPWWFCHGLPAPYADRPLRTIDPHGRIAAAIPLAQVVGCVIHLTCAMPEPGLVRHGRGWELIIGEPAGGRSARVAALGETLGAAGFAVALAERIQADIWYKLWGNMTMNPISALTGAASDRILGDPLVDRFCREVMREAAAIGARIGCPIAESGAARNAVTRKLGAFRTSMQRDAEAGKPLEIDALLTAVQEMGGWVGITTPFLDALLGLIRVFAQVRGLYPETPAAGAAS